LERGDESLRARPCCYSYFFGGGRGAAAAGRPTYRRRRARNVDRNHHKVHAGLTSRVGGAGKGESGVAGFSCSCRGGAGFARGQRPPGAGRPAAAEPASEVVGRGRFVRLGSSHEFPSDGWHGYCPKLVSPSKKIPFPNSTSQVFLIKNLIR